MCNCENGYVHHSFWGWVKCKLCDGGARDNVKKERSHGDVVREETLKRQHDGESVHSSEFNSGRNPYWEYWRSVDEKRKNGK